MFLMAKTAQAIQHAQSALRLDPGHEPAMRLRKRVKDVDRLKDEGNTAFREGRLEDATARYNEALEVRALSRVLRCITLIFCWRHSGLERVMTRAKVVIYGRCCCPTELPRYLRWVNRVLIIFIPLTRSN